MQILDSLIFNSYNIIVYIVLVTPFPFVDTSQRQHADIYLHMLSSSSKFVGLNLFYVHYTYRFLVFVEDSAYLASNGKLPTTKTINIYLFEEKLKEKASPSSYFGRTLVSLKRDNYLVKRIT